MTKTNSDSNSVTNEDIRALMSEAGEHGDIAAVKVCRAALNGSGSARTRCAKWIESARNNASQA